MGNYINSFDRSLSSGSSRAVGSAGKTIAPLPLLVGKEGKPSLKTPPHIFRRSFGPAVAVKTDVTKDGKHNGGTKISEIREFVKLFHEQLNEFILGRYCKCFFNMPI